MLGRAGRGNREGHGVVLVPAKSSRSAAEVAAAIKEERLPELRSSFDVPQRRRTRSERPSEAGEQVRHAAGLVASLIARHGKEGLSFLQVERFLSRSLGGAQLAARVPAGAEWLTDPSRLSREFEQIRANGYSVDNEEYLAGICCLAVPVRDSDGRVVAGVAVHAPATRMRLDQAMEFLPTLRQAADAISQTIDW